MQNSSYPRPQLKRGDWMSLDGPWRFAFDAELRYRMPGEIMSWPLMIQVPFAPEAARSGLGDTGFHRACWYERDFDLSAEQIAGGNRVLLHFGAVDYHARVWLNGVPVAEHEGGHTPFVADITFAVRREGPQRVTVWAEDDPHDLEKPRGKQTWRVEPHGIWYPRTTGIWQTVWVESVPSTYIVSIQWTPNVERWEIGLDASTAGEPRDDLRITVRLSCEGRVLADDTYAVWSAISAIRA